MSEPMDKREEVELPVLQGPTEGIWDSLVRHRGLLKAALLANQEKDAEIARLIGCLKQSNAGMEEYERKYYLELNSKEDIEAELSSLRASVGGEKWIDVKQELPSANVNHCWLAWITAQNKNGGYIDLVSYGEYICFNEECHEGNEDYIEHDDGNMKRAGWYREEETHGGEFDYIFVDLNDKVTHWQPLPAPPSLPTEKEM